jgi:hypothetical protein
MHAGNERASEPPAAGPRDLALLSALLLLVWLGFATFVESFDRDDNLGGCGPVLADAASRILQGKVPTHSTFFGGGGGGYVSPWLNGFVDPLVLLPALVLRHDVAALMNVVMALHVALFGGGGYFLAWMLQAPRWACRVAGLSLGCSGYFVVWAGNWSSVLIPYAFLPWLLASLLALMRSCTRRELIVYELLACLGVVGTFLTGLLFAALYGGLVGLFVVGALGVRERAPLRRYALRLLPPLLVLVVLVAPLLAAQAELYRFLGGRKNDPIHWVVFSVPLQAYNALLWPFGTSVWRTVFFPEGRPFTNLLMACGAVPAWYMVVDVLRRPRGYANLSCALLALGLLVMVVVLSPGTFHLQHFFAQLPVVNAFRWPFRALPAFHVLLVASFAQASRSRSPALAVRWQRLLPALVIACSTVVFAQDLALRDARQPVRSWFSAAPRFDDPESWSAPTLQLLRAAGNVANACHDEVTFYRKPRLFFYGTLGAQYGVRTVHVYVVPPFRAYAPLGATIKGCFRKWDGVRALIEGSPQRPLASEPRWDTPLGPRNFEEIVRKTFVGAVIVEPSFEPAMRYFAQSASWVAVERHADAVAFVRASLLPALAPPR